MKTQRQRINNVIGQLEAVKKMMDEEKDCFAVLTQLKAAKSGVSRVMHNHVQEHVMDCMQFCGTEEDKKRLQNLLDELSRQ
jgi:DNA-binding FrmR family transcriptional regulator